VLAEHLFGDRGPPAYLPGWLQQTIAHGWLGVDLFFVLSGYLITTILVGNRSAPTGDYFRTFYERRALRILPLYLLVIAVLWAAGGKPYIPFLLICLLFAANLENVFHFPGPPGAGPLWSLAVEEQFYLVWPWFVRWFDSRGLVAISVTLLVLEPLARLSPIGGMEFTWGRADGLAMGALLALRLDSVAAIRERSGRLLVCFLAIAAVLAVADLVMTNEHRASLAAHLRVSEAVLIFGALVAFGIAFSGARVSALLRAPFARITANYSYALYLVHAPLYVAYGRLIGPLHYPFLATQLPSGWLTRGVTVLIASYGVAAFTRRFVELPFLRLGRPTPPL
jgi:peptidoglycan/LPS O-acetylase OafA/YrhL